MAMVYCLRIVYFILNVWMEGPGFASITACWALARCVCTAGAVLTVRGRPLQCASEAGEAEGVGAGGVGGRGAAAAACALRTARPRAARPPPLLPRLSAQTHLRATGKGSHLTVLSIQG